MNDILRVHLVYPLGNRISKPDTIGQNLKHTLEKFYNLKETYDESFDHERFNIECPNIYNRIKIKCKKFLKII